MSRLPPASAIAASMLLLAVTVHAEPSQTDPLLAEMQEHFHATKKWFGMVADLGVDTAADGTLAPRFETLRSKFVLLHDAAGQTLDARLPPTSDGIHVVSFGGMPEFSVRTQEVGAPSVRAEIHRGVVVYRGAVAGGDLLYKLTPTHVDEYVYLRVSPGRVTRRFDFDTGSAVAALREAGDMVEVIGKDGIARLRMSAPLARAVDGKRRRGTIHVTGRELVEDIDLTGLATPILLDPDWSTTGTETTAHWADAAWRRPDDRVMVVGGCTLTSCPKSFAQSSCGQVIATTDIWDPASGTWTSGSTMATPRYAFAGVPLASGDMLVAGGCTSTACASTTATAERFSVATGAWSSAGNLASPRSNPMASLLSTGELLLAGGCDVGACTKDAERYDPTTNAWSAVAELPAARGFATATTLADGRVLVTGGCADPACAAVLGDALVYDPTADAWSAAGTMSSPRAGHSATLLGDGSVLVAGGCSDGACTTSLATADLWTADATGGKLTPARSMASARHNHTATTLSSGEVLVAGGATSTGSSLPTAEVYFPVAKAWVEPSSMAMARAYHSGVLLASGDVLVAGGCNPQTCLPWAEVFSPASLLRDSDAGVPDAALPPPGFDASFDGSGTVVLAPPTPVATSPHPPLYRDGVVTCATDTAQDLGCPVEGWELQDGDFQPNTRSYGLTADQVTDLVTGLIWQAGGDGNMYKQGDAARYCAALSTPEAPAGSFRLPTVVELMTIVDYGVDVPATDPRFRGTASTNYWTSSAVVGGHSLVWTVKFDAGEVIPLLTDTPNPVRCVRGKSTALGPGGVGLRKAGPLQPGADTVKDMATGLEWQRQDDGVKRSWSASLAYCATLGLGGESGWHLPNVAELTGIVEYGKSNGGIAIDPAFESPKADEYWTSSQNEGTPTLSWGVNFNLGVVDGVTVSGLAYARCVRHLEPTAGATSSSSGSCGCGVTPGAGDHGMATLLQVLGVVLVAVGAARARKRC